MEMTANWHCQDRLGEWLLESLAETLGEEQMKALAERFDGGDESSKAGMNEVLAALEDWFGQPGSQGMSVQAGRNAFNLLLQKQGEELGWFSQRFRLLPKSRRIHEGLSALVNFLVELCGTSIRLEEDEHGWHCTTQGCAWGGMDGGNLDLCYFQQGLLQEFMLWASGGRLHLVNVAACAAQGEPACVIRIARQPLEA